MFDKLLDLIVQFAEHLKPFFIMKEFNEGVRLRFGKFNEILKAGIHFKIPFVDEIFEHSIAWTAISLPVQSVTTKDDKSIVIKCVIKYRVVDIQHFMIDVYDAPDAISDMTCGYVREQVEKRTWDECKLQDIDKKITTEARREAKRWGLEIDKVTITDMGVIKSIRLYNEQHHHL
jgi:regulator of protease activity HflC (stomatin/prohibitin superfamily)